MIQICSQELCWGGWGGCQWHSPLSFRESSGERSEYWPGQSIISADGIHWVTLNEKNSQAARAQLVRKAERTDFGREQ